jgi:hypothetical protein
VKTIEVDLSQADTVRLVQELYDRGVSMERIEVLYNSLDDYMAGKYPEEMAWQ